MPVGFTTVFTGLLGSAGVAAATADIIAPILGGASFGALSGGTLSAITGHGFGKGAEFGALTGGALGAAGPLGEALGIGGGFGQVALDTALGAGAGALGGVATGSSAGKGALFGGLSGAATGLISNAGSTGAQTPDAKPGGLAGPAGGGTAAETAVNVGGTGDLTSPAIYGSGAGTITSTPLAAPSAVGDIGGIENINVAGIKPTGALSTGTAMAAGAGAGAAATLGGGNTGSTALGTSPTGASPPTQALQDSAAFNNTFGTLPDGTAITDKVASGSSGFGSAVSKRLTDPGTLLGVGGLAYQAATQPKLPDAGALTTSLKGTADQLSAQGNKLMSFINTGTLPPGARAVVDQASQAAKARVRSQYASLGLTGSTSEASALAQVEQSAAGQVWQIAENLLQTGIKETGLSTELYQSILKEVDVKNTNMGAAISNFAAALAGGGNRGVTLNVGGTGNA